EELGMSRTARPSAMATAPANAAQMDRRGRNITVSHAKVEPVFRRQASPMTSGTRMHKPARYDMMTSYPDPAEQFIWNCATAHSKLRFHCNAQIRSALRPYAQARRSVAGTTPRSPELAGRRRRAPIAD